MSILTHPLIGEWYIIKETVPLAGIIRVDYYMTFYANGTGKTTKPNGDLVE